MNLNDNKYKKYALVKEMMETVEVVKNFRPSCAEPFVEAIKKKSALTLNIDSKLIKLIKNADTIRK